MKILDYNQVDPLKVVYLTQLALDFPLTPETAASIRKRDPRAFPCLAIYAVEDDTVAGQVGIFRLPMISTEGREDVGGIWAVSIHPEYAGRGIASLLIEEAHTRMRATGLRFSTLGTDRYRAAYKLYHRHGYEETNIWATALARWETANQPTRLCAERSGSGGYEAIEHIYQEIARDYLGFAWRHSPFSRLRLLDLADIWILKENKCVIGYAFTRLEHSMLIIRDLVLRPEINILEAIAAVAARLKSTYIQIEASRPADLKNLRGAGYHVAHPNWDSFMIKPLTPDVNMDVARKLFGIGTDQFLISRLDVT
jgi:GNAT superfamily N-acetyltransferase